MSAATNQLLHPIELFFCCVSVREKLEQEFKSQDKSVVESTLGSCSYDEDKARFELQLLGIAKAASEAATSASTATVTPR